VGKYGTLGSAFDRIFRNTLNKALDDVDADIKAQKKRVDDLLVGNPQPSEVVDSRGGFPVLRDRLDDLSSSVAQSANNINTNRINVLYPPAPLTACKGDGVTDDYPSIKAIIDYAIANNRAIKIPTSTYLLSAPLIFDENIHLDIEGGDKENCKLQWTSGDTGIWFKRGVVKMSNLQILANLALHSTFKPLQLGDVLNADPNDSLHWSKFSNLKISGCNQGIRIGNMFDSSMDDIDITNLTGTTPSGIHFVSGTNVNSNNILFNRVRIENSVDGGTFLNFNAGSTAATANFVFNGCHFEAHRLDSNMIVIKDAYDITFISCQFSHTSASGETVDANYKNTFIFNNALGVKFVACGIGASISTNTPTAEAPKLIKLMGSSRYISFDNCRISPPWQPATIKPSDLFNVDGAFTGEYPVFDNCMLVNNTRTLDRVLQGFSSMANSNNKMYIGTGSDYGLHVVSGKWDLNSTPDDVNNYTPFTSFKQNGMIKTAGVVGRHSGTLTASTVKVIAYNGRSGALNSGMYVVNVLTDANNFYTALIAYNASFNTITTVHLGSIFSTTKDTASKINLYSEGSQLKIQNTQTFSVTYSIVPFLMS
jgi:hypothetical protein